MVSLRKIYRPGERYFRDVYKSIVDEQTFAVTNLAANARLAKVIYCKAMVPFLFERTIVGFNIQADLKTTNTSLYNYPWVGFWTVKRNVGDEVAGSLSALADYVYAYSLLSSSLTYEFKSGLFVPYYAGSLVTVGTIPYFTVWLQARNVSGSPLSGTIYAKNIRAWGTIGVVKG